VEGGMRQQQVNSKKLLSSFMYLLARHIKEELAKEVPQLGF
jgi:hypothetical protein